jgi:putative MATE family efflux protein
MKKSNSYLEGNVGSLLFNNSIPMLFGVGAAIAFNFVDTLFIAKLGTLQLAAITFTFPIVFIIIGVSMGIGVGASAVISRAYGENDVEKVNRLTTHSIILAFLVAVIFSSIGLLFFEEVFVFMGAKSDTIPYIKDFMYIWYLGIPFITIPMVGNSALRALGDTKTPSFTMVGAVLINLVLDPIFIFGFSFVPSFGIKGAAIATLFGRFFSLMFSLIILIKKYNLIRIKYLKLNGIKDSIYQIMEVGLPNSLTNILLPMGMSIVIGLVSNYGEAAVAAMGAASRIEMLTMTVFMALGSVLGPFIGQNWGAKNNQRIFEAIRLSYFFSIFWGLFTFILFYVFKKEIALFVKDDAEVVKYIIIYLSITPISIAFRGVLMIISTSFNVLKKPIWASLITIFQMFIVFIPLAYILSHYYGFNGILYASVFSSIIVSIFALILNNKYLKTI